MKRLIFVLLCAVCLVSCSDTSVSEESSSSEEVSVIEIVADTTTTVSASTTVTGQTTTQTTAPIVTYSRDVDYIPKNAVYKQNHYRYNTQGEKMLRFITFYDEYDKEIRTIGLRSDISNQYTDYDNIYDDNGNLIYSQMIRHASDSDDIYASRDEYEYDDKNRLKLAAHYMDNLKHWETYEYDADGRLIREDSWYDGDKNPRRSIVSEYDENGNVKIDKEYNHDSDTEPFAYVEYEYDENGRKITEHYENKAGYSNTTEYTYDDRGNILTLDMEYHDFYNTQIYTYDEKNRCTSEKGLRRDGTVVFSAEYEYEDL